VTTIERVSPSDLAELEWESIEAPMHIAAILQLATGIDSEDLRTVLANRIRGVPRLRQRLMRPSVHSRRASWVDDPDFTLERHVSVTSCPPPGDENALLELAATESNRLLPRDRPLWRLVQVTDLRGGRDALVVVVHHAVADGIGGLAVLAQLMDQPTRSAGLPTPPSESPRRDQVGAADARQAMRRSMRAAVQGVPTAFRDLAAGIRAHPQRCSLNEPIGPHRHLAVARTALAPLVATARRHEATVNDLLLVATVDSLHTVLAAEGEDVHSLTVSVPVSRRTGTTANNLGNEVDAMPVSVPCDGPLRDRLGHTAAMTRRRRRSGHRSDHGDASRLWLQPVFWLLARLGLFQWFIRRQRLVNTFLTNVKGPTQELALLGVPVIAVTPVSPIAGNVTVAFTAFSYAGTLSVTVVADADRWSDARPIAAAFDEALDKLIREG
jgi:WS/DGAT/MGAT family acyltransferase